MSALPSVWARLRALAADRSGNSAFELIIVTPVLMGMMLGATDLALAFSQRVSLEQAAGRTAEMVTAPGTVALSYSNLPAEATAAYGHPIESANADNWLECDGARQSSFTGSCPTTQQTARYIAISISAEYVPIFAWGGLLKGRGPNNGFVLTGDATVRVQ
jgi:hypothetical protein